MVGGAGMGAVVIWVDSGCVFTVGEAVGFCSTGGEGDLEIRGVDVSRTGETAATSVGRIDVEGGL